MGEVFPRGSISGFFVVSPSNSRHRLNSNLEEAVSVTASVTSFGQTLSLINGPSNFEDVIDSDHTSYFVPFASALVLNVPRFSFKVDVIPIPQQQSSESEFRFARVVVVRFCVMNSDNAIVRTLYARKAIVSPDCPLVVDDISFDNILVGAGENLCLRFDIGVVDGLARDRSAVVFNSLTVVDY